MNKMSTGFNFKHPGFYTGDKLIFRLFLFEFKRNNEKKNSVKIIGPIFDSS